MTERGRDKSATVIPPSGLSVAEVYEKYLDWCQKNRSRRSYEWYRGRIQNFCNSLKARDEPIRPPLPMA